MKTIRRKHMKSILFPLVTVLALAVTGAASGQTVWLEDGDAPAWLPDQNTIGPGALSSVGGALANDPSDLDRNTVPLAADEPAGPRDGGPRAACCGDVIVGTGSGTTNLYPLNSSFKYYRSMSLIRQSELTCTNPNPITKLAIYIGTPKSNTFTNVVIKMKKTADTELTTAWVDDGTLVWSGSTAMTPGYQWKTFDITDFVWDADNLLITWQWNGTSTFTSPTYIHGPAGFTAQAYGGSATAFPTTLTTGTSRVYYKLSFPVPLTAKCCYGYPDVQCLVTDQAGCTALNGTLYLCQDCSTACPPWGACCVGVTPWCIPDKTEAECLALGGTYAGPATACDPGVCPRWGACCKGYEDDPRCVIVKDAATCWSTYLGDWMGENTTCDAITCPPYGACCAPSTGNCYIRSQYYCNYSSYVWLGPDYTCSPTNPCPQPTGACCLGETCEVLTKADCLAQSGTYIYDWEPCAPDKCKTGACCFSTGGCLELANWYCSGYAVLGTFMGPGTICYPNPCSGFTTDWSDNFDSYDNGTLLYHVGGWTGWDDLDYHAGTVSNAQARSAPHSIVVNDTADAIHPFVPVKAGGQWVIKAWQYIPSGLSNATYFIVNSFYEHGGPYFTMIQLRFDPVSGKVWDDLRTSNCQTGLPLVYDQWVEIRIEVDFVPSLGTVSEYYNNQLLCSDNWIVPPVGQKYIANIDLYAPHMTPVYYDDLSVAPAGAALHPTVPLFVGKEGTTTTPTRTTDLTGFPNVTWKDGFQGVGISGAAGRADGYLYLADGSSSGRYLYLAPFQGPAVQVCRHASYYFYALAYGRGKLYGFLNTGTKGIYEINPTTCEATLRLATSPRLYFALDYNRADGLLYGYDEYGSPTGLYKIDIDAGTQTWVAGNIPGSNSAGRGMAIGNNKVYLVPSNQFPSMYVYDLAQGPGGTWQAMTGPFPSANPGNTGVAWVILPKPGDMNCDGVVDGRDIQGFVLALTDPATYSSTAPGWDCTLLNADVNLDGARNGQDIAPFVQLLIGA
jgi:hypothetical protein